MPGGVDVAKLRIDVDATKVRSGRRELDRLDKSGKQVTTTAQRLQRAFAAVGVTIGAGAVLRGIINTNREFQRLQAQLQTTEGSAEQAARAFKRIEDFAIRTPFEIESLTAALVQLRVRGANPTNKEITALGNIASSFTRDITEVANAVSSATAGMTLPLRNLGFEASVMGDTIKLSFGEASTTVDRTAGAIVSAMAELTGGRLAGAMEREMDTINGALSNLEDSAGKLSRAIGQAGLNDAILNTVQAMDRWTNALSENQESIKLWTGLVLDAAAAVGVAGLAGSVIFLTRALAGLATAGIARAAASFASFNVRLRGTALLVALLQKPIGPTGWMIAGVTLLTTAFFAWRRSVRETRDEMSGLGDEFERLRQISLDRLAAQTLPEMNFTVRSSETIAEERQERIDARQAELDAIQDLIDAGREYVRTAEEITAASERELDTAQRLFEAHTQGQHAVDQLTIALAGEQAALDAAEDVSAGELENIRRRAEAVAALEILTRKLTDQERERARATAAATTEDEKAKRAAEQRRQFYISTGLNLLGQTVGDNPVGGIFTGAVGAGFAGFGAAGAAGAAVGAIGAVVTGIIDMSKQASAERARQRREDQRFAENVNIFIKEQEARQASIDGREEEAEAMRDQIEIQRRAIRIRELTTRGEDPQEAMARELIIREQLIHESERAARIAEEQAEAERDLAAAREKALQITESLSVRALRAVGQTELADTFALRFAHRQETAQSVLDGATADELAFLAEIQSIETQALRLQQELNAGIQRIENRAQKQLEAIEEQLSVAEAQRDVLAEQVSAQQETVSTLRSVVGALTAFEQELEFGSGSPLSPFAQLEAARANFMALRERALGGDAEAAGEIPAAARALLEAQEVWSSRGPEFFNTFDLVGDTVKALKDQFGSQLSVEERILTELEGQTRRLDEQIQELKDNQREIRRKADQQIAALRSEFDSKNNSLWAIVQKLLDIKDEELSDIEGNTDRETFLQGQIAQKDSLIEIWRQAYTGLNDYWQGLYNETQSASAEIIQGLVNQLNNATGNFAANTYTGGRNRIPDPPVSSARTSTSNANLDDVVEQAKETNEHLEVAVETIAQTGVATTEKLDALTKNVGAMAARLARLEGLP